MPSDEPSRPYNWRPKSLAKLKVFITINKKIVNLFIAINKGRPLLSVREIQPSEIFRTMEIRRWRIDGTPGNILTVIAASHAIIHVDKECLPGKSAIIMAPE